MIKSNRTDKDGPFLKHQILNAECHPKGSINSQDYLVLSFPLTLQVWSFLSLCVGMSSL